MASTEIDYERWRHGVPYDLGALAELEGEERSAVENWLLARAGEDWRDLEGLLTLGSERARAAVVEQMLRGSIRQRLEAAKRLPFDSAIEHDREAAIVQGLAESTLLTGLSIVIGLAEAHPTQAVIDALFRAVLRPDLEIGVHAAALLAFLHGGSTEPFDLDRRQFFLQFHDADPAIGRAAFEQLCRECGVDATRYLPAQESERPRPALPDGGESARCQ